MFDEEVISAIKRDVAASKQISEAEADYYVFSDSVMNKAYNPEGFNIKILYKNGITKDITDASDQYNISALARPVTKYFLCYPKKV